MREIREGLKNNAEVFVYADSKLNWFQRLIKQCKFVKFF